MKQRMTASKLEPEAYRAVAYLDRRVAEAGIDGAEVEGEISEREVANFLIGHGGDKCLEEHSGATHMVSRHASGHHPRQGRRHGRVHRQRRGE